MKGETIYDRECKGEGSHSRVTRSELADKLDGYYRTEAIPALITQLDNGELDALATSFAIYRRAPEAM
jgi:hypothetical protein